MGGESYNKLQSPENRHIKEFQDFYSIYQNFKQKEVKKNAVGFNCKSPFDPVGKKKENDLNHSNHHIALTPRAFAITRTGNKLNKRKTKMSTCFDQTKKEIRLPLPKTMKNKRSELYGKKVAIGVRKGKGVKDKGKRLLGTEGLPQDRNSGSSLLKEFRGNGIEKNFKIQEPLNVSASVDFAALKFRNYSMQMGQNENEEGNENISPSRTTSKGNITSTVTTLRELDNQTVFTDTPLKPNGVDLRSSITFISSEDAVGVKYISKSLNSLNIRALEDRLKRVKEETDFYKNEKERILHMYDILSMKNKSYSNHQHDKQEFVKHHPSSGVASSASVTSSVSTLSDNYYPEQLSEKLSMQGFAFESKNHSNNSIAVASSILAPAPSDLTAKEDRDISKGSNSEMKKQNYSSEIKDDQLKSYKSSVSNIMSIYDEDIENDAVRCISPGLPENLDDEDTDPDRSMDVIERSSDGFIAPDNKKDIGKHCDNSSLLNQNVTIGHENMKHLNTDRTNTFQFDKNIQSYDLNSGLPMHFSDKAYITPTNTTSSTFDFVVDENWQGDEEESWENDDDEAKENNEDEKQSRGNDQSREGNKRNEEDKRNNGRKYFQWLRYSMKSLLQKLSNVRLLSLFLVLALIMIFVFGHHCSKKAFNSKNDRTVGALRVTNFVNSPHISSQMDSFIFQEKNSPSIMSSGKGSRAGTDGNTKSSNSYTKETKKTLLKNQSFKSKLKEVKPFDNGNFQLNPYEYISSCTMLAYYYDQNFRKSNLERIAPPTQQLSILKQMHPLCTFNLFLYLHEDGNLYLFEGDSPADIYFSTSSNNAEDALEHNNLFSDIQTGKPLIIPSPIWSTSIQVSREKDKVSPSETHHHGRKSSRSSKYSTFASFDSEHRIFRIQQVKKNDNYHFSKEDDDTKNKLILWERSWHKLPRLYIGWVLPELYSHLGTSLGIDNMESSIHIHQLDKYRVAYSKRRLCLLPYSYQLLSPVKDFLLPEYVFFVHVPTLISNTKENIIDPLVVLNFVKLNLWFKKKKSLLESISAMQISKLRKGTVDLYTTLIRKYPQTKNIYDATVKSYMKVIQQILKDVNFKRIVMDKKKQGSKVITKIWKSKHKLHQLIKNKKILQKVRSFVKRHLIIE